MATSVILRTVSESDVAAITALYADAVINTTTTYELEPPNQASMRGKISNVVDAGFSYLVAEEANASEKERLLGFAYVSPFRARPAYRFTAEHSVYVAKSARRRGIGRLLLNAVIRDCERLGFHQMVAVIGDAEYNSPSIAFHQGTWGFGIVVG